MESTQTSSMFTSLTETDEASLCGGVVSITKGTVKKGAAGKKGTAGKKGASASVKKVKIVKSTTGKTTTTTSSVLDASTVSLLASLFA
ncbi:MULTISPECIES: hypothetical protein [unclassified Nostoc]|uniref:hypothetical protein n=1 Tax=unclassified Nostoc TaxID=2593658 RepID=UPI002627E3D5|nr:hypothetical protein [Nostoc sp. S13]MDF5737480.1 hypothetical protein [Nostoc sp. S13]